MNANQEAATQDRLPLFPSCQITIETPFQATAVITVEKDIVDALYREASYIQMHNTEAQGFKKGSIPLGYIQDTYSTILIEHIEEFLINYYVSDMLYREIRDKKLLLSSEPVLTALKVVPGHDATFTFSLSLCPEPDMGEWKYLPFKAPKRKNYKDIDRQVSLFLQEELSAQEKSNSATIDIGDWVHFTVTLVNADKQPLFKDQSHAVWLKIGDEEADNDFKDLLIGLPVQTELYTKSRALQDFFSTGLTTDYLFRITIHDILKSTYFCFESFKKQFRLKTNKDLHRKLIEVFSFRNDISQRRAMAEEALHLILSRHHFSIPENAITQQEQELIERIKQSPDYHVYRNQKDFKHTVHQLAEKQAREMILLDQIAYMENIKVIDADIRSYLNLANRPRMKDFIYFDMPVSKIGGQETPLSTELLKTYCLREKALNFIVYHLTRE